MTQYIYAIKGQNWRDDRFDGFYVSEERALEALSVIHSLRSSKPDEPPRGEITQFDLNDEQMPIPQTRWNLRNEKLVYGERINWRGENDYGWLDMRDEPIDDPEYQEFKRLRDKFGVSGWVND